MNTFAMQLNDPIVRQLLWCITGAELAHMDTVESLNIPLDVHLKDWFMALDQQPTPLHLFLEQTNNKRLGAYFECLWQFFLSHYPDWQLNANNLQIIEEKKTLGELDILAVDAQGAGYHLELAVKFYLQHPDHSGQESRHWLGPQSIDKLDKKLLTLRNKQFPILHHPRTQKALLELNIPLPTRQRLILKGYLFHHWQKEFLLPNEANEKCLMGEWLHQKDIKKLTANHEHWLLVLKPLWLGTVKHALTPNDDAILNADQANKTVPVSYTHLTLPTIYSV